VRTKLSHSWITFLSLSLLFFLVSAGTFSSLGVVLPAMVREMGWNWTQAGAGYTILGLGCGLASFIPAVLIRQIGVRGTLILGTVLLVAGFAALAVTHTAWLYLVGTLVVGVAFAFTSTVPATHVLTSLFRRRSTVLGAYFTIGGLGQVAGPLLYVLIQSVTHGWRTYWIMFVIAAAVLGGFAIATTPGRRGLEPEADAPPEQVGPREMFARLHDWTVRHALMTPQFYVIVFAYTTYLLINTTAHGFAVEHLTERGIDPKAAAGMLSLEALIGAGVSVIGGVLGEKVSSKSMLLVALVSLTIGMGGLAEARGYPLMLVYAVGVGVGYGLSFVAPTMLLLTYFGRKANLELYSIMCLISTSAALGPAFGGWVRDAVGSFSQMFWVCTAFTFAMLIATAFLRPPTHVAAAASTIRREPAT
jgi:MFS family permease